MEQDTRFLIDLWVVFIVCVALLLVVIGGFIVLITENIKDSIKKESLLREDKAQAVTIVRKKMLITMTRLLTVVIPPIAGFYFKMPFIGIMAMFIFIALWVNSKDTNQFFEKIEHY